MILLLGLTLGLGLVLCGSPVLWPAARSGVGTVHPPSLWRDRMTQAGLGSVGIPTVVLVSILVGLVVAAAFYSVVPVAALAVAAGLVGIASPALVIGWRAKAHRRAGRVLWPDVVDHLVSGVRAGLALPDSVITIAHSGPTQTRGAFAAFERDYLATGNFSPCLDRLKDRLADPVADRILETLRMSREVGGTELPTVLRNLASYLRQEAAIRGEVEARQSWVMNAARLGAAAPWVVLALLATRPEAAAAYNSTAGVAMIVAGLVVTVIAYRVMLAIARLPEERRWFQ